MATTLDKYGNAVVNGYSTNLPPPQVDATTIQSGVKPFAVPPQQPTQIDPSIATGAVSSVINDFTNLQNQQKQQEQSQKESAQRQMDLSGMIEGKTAYTQTAQESTGVNQESAKQLEYYQQLANLNAQASSLQREAQAIPIQIQQEAQGQGVTDRGVAPIQAGRLRENALKALSIAQQADIASAALTGSTLRLAQAKEKAQQMVDLKYKPIEEALAREKELYTLNKDVLDRVDKKRSEALALAIKKEEQATAEKKQNEKDMQSLSLTVAKNGAPQRVQEIIKNAKDFNEAVIAATPYLQSEQDKADLSYKVAQTAKIYADMENDARTLGSNVAPETMLPFAQEYAATGKIPLGAPKGSQSSIMKYAKELPQAPGSLVSSITGVKNTSLGVDAQGDIVRLYNITKAVKELKKLDEERIGGLVAGTAGKVFGSEAQSDYLAKRKAIVDDLSRMQSGAALTESEVKFYEDYLPGRLSETFGLGQDSLKKIENFEKIMNEKLKNSLSNNQLSIYGYSTVKVDNGQEYTVGDLIQVNGRTGRINPDGTVTIVE